MDCPSCGTANPDQARFCLGCGTPLTTAAAAPAREERKVVSVLFADLVGFTARAEQLDPEDVERLLRPYHERLRADLERYGGRVEKFIGDAVMAVFGAPIAHEDDAERAVRAALTIRDWAREQDGVELRIAVNTGEALVNVDARPEQGQSMVKGDVVNTAARLQAEAPINGVIVGETTYHATSSAIEYQPLEPVVAKGKSEPVPAWEATGARARFGVDVRQVGGAVLVGRQRELDALLDALSRARGGREPQLVTLVGVPGMGKSRLVWELFQRLDAEPDFFTWRQGRSLAYGEGISFWALGEMVKAQAGILESDDPDTAAAKLEQSVIGVLRGDEQHGWVNSHLRPLVGLGAGQELPADRRGEAFAAWRRYIEALAEQQPLVLVFEDLHWADEGLLDFVDYLAEWASGVPLLIVGTARPELLSRRPGWGGGKANALTLSLPPLSADETTTLVHALLDRPVLDADTQQALIERAGGNPLYAEEFVRLAEEGRAQTTLPESVQAIIAARLDALAADEKRLLQQAAVLGKVFWLGGLADVSGQGRWAVEEMLHRLERREFVRRERQSSVAAETEYAFRHALVREVAYEQLPRAERAERHRRAAQWIESLGRPGDTAEMLAHHYLSALEYGRAAGVALDDIVSAARAALSIAGERALALNSFAAAERFFAAALDLAAADSIERPMLLFGHARALHATGSRGATDALAEASSALVRAGDREHAAEAEVMGAELWWSTGDRHRADEHLARAQELIAGAGRTPSRARVLSEISRYHMIADRHQAAIAVGRESLELARELRLPEIEAHALDNIGAARFFAGDAGGIADLERSLEVALAAGSPEAARTYNNLAAAYWLGGDEQRALELVRQAMLTDRRYGRERIARFAEGRIINHAFVSGRWDEFLSEARRFAAESARLGRSYQELYHLAREAQVALARDDEDRALSTALAAADWAREVGESQVLGPACNALAHVQVELGMARAARETLGELAPAAPSLWLLTDAVPIAASAADPELKALIRSFVPSAPPSKWATAISAILDGDAAEAADLLEEMTMAPYAALARMRAADNLLAAGRPVEARAQLERALRFWRSVQATRYVRRAEDMLSQIGTTEQADQPPGREERAAG